MKNSVELAVGRTSAVVLMIMLLNCLMPGLVLGGGFRIYDQGAAAAGQANAFTAQADDPSAIHYNPAGITHLRGLQLYGGANLVGGATNFTSPVGVMTRGNFGNSIASPAPFNFYMAGNLADLGLIAFKGLSAGIGITTPFGLLYRYPMNGPFATAVTQQQLPMIDIKPTLSYQLNDQLSFGVGADIYTFSGLFSGAHGFDQKFLSSGRPGLPPAGVPLELNGSDTAAGFNLSMLYTPLRNADGKPIANVGFVYRSQATLHLTGDFLANGSLVTHSSSTLVLPQIFTAGIAVWPVRDQAHEWKLELDIDYTDWKSVRNTDVHFANGTTIPFAQNWRGTYTTMMGTEYKWLHVPALPNWEIALRAGYWHSQTPVPNSAFNPAIPDADQHMISVGLGSLCKAGARFFSVIPCSQGSRWLPSSIGLDVAYQAILYESRTVTGNTNPIAIPGSVNGTYQTMFHVAALNLRLNF